MSFTLNETRQGNSAAAEPPDSASTHVVVIEPKGSWRGLDIHELWRYRELLWVLTVRDIKVRYKQTALGILWVVIQPLLLMGVFSLFLGQFAKVPSDGFPYPLFVYAGLVPWTFFANAISTAGNSLVSSAQLITKVYFPRMLIPLSSIGAGLLDLALSGALLLPMLLWYGIGWPLSILLAPVLIVGIAFTALGAGLILSALMVAYRDVRFVIPFLIQFWMFATPVVYPSSIVPARWHWVLYLNPMSGFIEGLRAAFLGTALDVPALAASFAMSLVLLLLGAAYFARVERKFADVI
jgi:lipopolysaccharide transport system permease protein